METPFTPGETVYIIDYTNLRRTPGYVNKPKDDIQTVITPITHAEVTGTSINQDHLDWWPVALADGWCGWVAEASPIDLPLVAAITPAERDILIRDAATRLQLDPKLANAVFHVEAGPWVGPCARAMVRIELHVLFDFITQIREFETHFRFGPPDKPQQDHYWRPTIRADWRPVHRNQWSERAAIANAISRFGAEPVYHATSLGPGQVMGRHYAKLGYGSALAMYRDWVYNYPRQVLGFFNYLERTAIVDYLRNGDYHGFAYHYNGPANADDYAWRIQQALR